MGAAGTIDLGVHADPEMEVEPMIRVMIADDEEGIRDALSSLLDDDEQISVVGPDATPTRPSRSPHGNGRTSRCWMSACPEAGGRGPLARSPR